MLVREMSTHTLLLVDSSSKTAHEIRLAFAGEPIEVVVAEDGHSALDRIEADRPDVVLASTTALGVNGYSLAHYVSQRPYLSNVAVLLLTADASTTDTHRMKESGARGFVLQPIEPGAVVARVKEVLMLSEPEGFEVDVLGQLTTAFDAIDASMTSNVPGGTAPPGDHPITPEVLARIVNEAVTHALAAYEQARRLTPAPAPNATIGSGPRPTDVPLSPWRMERQRLQRDLGINEIEFEPKSHPRAIAGDQVRETLAPDSTSEFAYGIDDLPPLEVTPGTSAARPSAQPEADRRVEESVASATSVLGPLRDVLVSLGTALADQAGRFRSALAERAQRREQERTAAFTPAQPAAPTALAPAEPSPQPPVQSRSESR